jgi:hypothetical protein
MSHGLFESTVLILLGETEENLEIAGAWLLSGYNPLFPPVFRHIL